jgi:hypothetical protein
MVVWDNSFAYYLKIRAKKKFYCTGMLADHRHFAILSATVLAHQGQHSQDKIFNSKLQRK